MGNPGEVSDHEDVKAVPGGCVDENVRDGTEDAQEQDDTVEDEEHGAALLAFGKDQKHDQRDESSTNLASPDDGRPDGKLGPVVDHVKGNGRCLLAVTVEEDD